MFETLPLVDAGIRPNDQKSAIAPLRSGNRNVSGACQAKAR